MKEEKKSGGKKLEEENKTHTQKNWGEE